MHSTYLPQTCYINGNFSTAYLLDLLKAYGLCADKHFAMGKLLH
jgi:hypothetical protein